MNMNKAEIRSNLSADIAAFLSNGGSITVVASAKVKTKATCRSKTKLSYKDRAPGKVVSSWALVESSQ